MYYGTLDGSRVCIKRMRVYMKDGPQKAAKVRCWCCCIPRSSPLTKSAGFLSRSRNVETVDAPKHLTSPGCHHHSPSARLELDAGWGLARIYQEERRRKSTWTGWCPFRYVHFTLTSLQLSDVAKGLCYLHSCNVIHGDLKGVRGSTSYFTTVLTSWQLNILVDDSGCARIADFGLAKVTQNLDSMRSTSPQNGHSARWTAPEVLKEGTCSKEADIFSFAMVMIEVRHELSTACGVLQFADSLYRYRFSLARFHSILVRRPWLC